MDATVALVEPTSAHHIRGLVALLSRRVRATRARQRLTPTQVWVLMAMARHQGINPTMLSRIVARLDGPGLIARPPVPGDGRAVLLLATAEGQRRQRWIERERDAHLDRGVAGLDPARQGLLSAALPLLEELARGLARPAD